MAGYGKCKGLESESDLVMGGSHKPLTAHQERVYRLDCRPEGLVAFTVRVKETDLWILAEGDLTDEAVDAVLRHRRGLEVYLTQVPEALESLSPLPLDPMAPPLVRAMLRAGQICGTGPMAAVAGAISQAVGEDLLRSSAQVVVENGGDLFVAARQELTVGLFAGASPLSGRLGVRVAGHQMPVSLATSSGTVGHSVSMGRADAALVMAKDGALADAAATALGNRVRDRGDLGAALKWAGGVPGVLGALAVLDDRLAAWGDLTLVEIQ